MEKLSFGPKIGAVFQVSYVVSDIEREMERWTRMLGVGPFFLIRHFPLSQARYRGEPTDLDLDIALAFSGSMCFELIRQNNNAPSVFRELIAARGYGFHHWALSTGSFEADLARHEAAGSKAASTGVTGLGTRAAYLDTVSTLGGMLELIEVNPAVDAFFGMMHGAASNWDGADPVRTLSLTP